MTQNIIHLVLARLPDAPEGTKGISIFIVPKFLVNADGTLGERNDVFCAGIEHKLGINAQPDVHAELRRENGRRDRLPGRRSEPRARIYVHHDERGAVFGRRSRLAIADRAYQSALDIREGTRAEPRRQAARSRAARGDHPITPTCGVC